MSRYDTRPEEVRFSSVEVAVAVLEVIEQKNFEVSLIEIGRELGIGTTTAYRAVKLLRAQDALQVVRMGTGKSPTLYGAF